jgi:hypothetical protein
MNIEEQFDEQQRRLAAREQEQRAVEEAILKHQKRLLDAKLWRSCLNCINWIEKPNIGCMKFRALPPPNVIVHGCKDWEDDIPF